MSIWATCMSLMSNEESELQLLWEGEGRVIEKEWWESGDQNLVLIYGLAVWLSLRSLTENLHLNTWKSSSHIIWKRPYRVAEAFSNIRTLKFALRSGFHLNPGGIPVVSPPAQNQQTHRAFQKYFCLGRGDRGDKLKLVAADTVCSLNIHLPREKTFGWVYCNAAWWDCLLVPSAFLPVSYRIQLQELPGYPDPNIAGTVDERASLYCLILFSAWTAWQLSWPDTAKIALPSVREMLEASSALGEILSVCCADKIVWRNLKNTQDLCAWLLRLFQVITNVWHAGTASFWSAVLLL